MKLALANVRKGKSATASLFIFILVATLLLNIGLMVITQLSTFFDQKAEQLKDPHLVITMNQASYHSDYEAFLANYSGVKETETEEVIDMNLANYYFGNGEVTNNIIIFNADTKRAIAPAMRIDQLNSFSGNDIFVPYSFNTDGGYQLGDDFTITFQAKQYNYRIAGFFETTMMGMNNNGVMKVMLPEAGYQLLSDQIDSDAKGMIISVLNKDKSTASQLKEDFIGYVERFQSVEATPSLMTLDIIEVKEVSTLTVNIIATILVAFAVIIVLVALIVIKFSISNNIEDGIVNIGVLKAVGYTSRQIISSILLQFMLITLCSGVVGIALSYALMPIIGGIIATLTGLLWVQTIALTVNMVSVFLVALCVAVVTIVSTFRIRRISPVHALRGGIQTHNFRKNHLPLATAKGSLHLLLALKSMLTSSKQNVMITLIVAALTFATVFSGVLYYNIASDKTAFINLFGTEPANVYIAVQPEANTHELITNIEQMNHVSKVNIFDLINTKIDGQNVYTNVTDHYNNLENDVVYQGRQPKHDNELSISWVVSKKINKGIGDAVEVEYGAETASYLVTGLSQSIGNLGQISSMTLDGIQHLQSNYQGTTLYVYLAGISNKEFMSEIQKQYGDAIIETLDIDENIESQTGMYTAAVFAVMVMVLIITVIVVVMILYLVIKTLIIKRKKEFGILKAIGYSTFQLMNQIAMSYLPIIMIGVTAGGGLGYFFTNPMLSLLLSAAGVKRLSFAIHIPSIIFLCLSIFVLAYLVSMLIARQIKQISAYDLIIE
ncbi:putative ABC transport system permease protein [Amphibacillus marinus]|uniref:Putative ABC transport system permease protein n=1 Tax=Amphibacillus marinus TaxID=872970 RepID=A0A1H8KKU0_9BACI|nr:ABC transporter permease [Amphibacillus marinus]SEN93542.1 putative ABC transport system permease protein [Amphibacillus marinus]